MNLIKILVDFIKLNNIASHLVLDKSSIYGTNFRVELRDPQKKKKYLKIGRDCIINGTFVFEDKSGYIEVGNRVSIGDNTQIISREYIYVGDDTIIDINCMIYDHDGHSLEWKYRKNDVMNAVNLSKKLNISNKMWEDVIAKSVCVHSKVWICRDCKILKGVTIGEGAVILPGSIVTKDVKPWTIVGGAPAKFVKKINCNEN